MWAYVGIMLPYDLFIYSFIYFITFCFYIYLHVYTLFGPLPTAQFPGRTCSTLLFSYFVEEKTSFTFSIRDNRKNIVFLLVWGKDSYTERVLALLPSTCVLQPTWVHLYQVSSLLPHSLPIVALSSVRLLYSLL
jgi:hypothetical protein